MDRFTEKKWFVYIKDHHEGPHSIEEIGQRVSLGEVTQGTFVWAEGMPDWKVITEISELESVFKPAQQPAATSPPVEVALEPAPKPGPQSEISEQAPVSDKTIEPQVQVAPAEPVAEPEIQISSAEPVAEPSLQLTTSEPGTETSIQPTSVEPALESNALPIAAEPALEPSVQLTAAETTVESKFASPATVESTPEPSAQVVATEAIPEPTVELVATESSTQLVEPSAQLVATEPAQEPSLQETQPQPTEAPEPTQETHKPKRRIPPKVLKWVVAVLFLIFCVGGYTLGFFDGVINSPTIQNSIEMISESSRPWLVSLSEKIPALSKWVSPIPKINDISTDEFEDLKAAARAHPESPGPHLAIALSKTDTSSPSFYVAANLPDGAQFHIYIIGIPDTLLNQLSFGGQTDVSLTKKIGKTTIVRFADGKPIPKGEYTVYVVPFEGQPADAKPLIAAFPAANVNVPPELPKDSKILLYKTYFLGGTRDATYTAKLKEYHEKLRAKASTEINEVKQFAATLESQLNSTATKFSLIRKGKVTLKQRQAWETFHNEWMRLQGQLDQIFMSWSPEAIQNNFFYGVLYLYTQQAGQSVEKVHGFHHAYFNGAHDQKTFEIQLGEAFSSAQSSIGQLRAKIEQAEKIAPTPNGMPRREGL